MVYEVKLPDIGEGVAEGEILKWMVQEGEPVKEDQPLVEVMTDKVNVQIPSPRTGKVSKILVKEGDIANVGQVIVVIDDGSGPGPATGQVESKPSSRPMQPAPQPTQVQGPSTVLATPATRRIARELRVEIASVRGSGPQGRVTDDDVRKAASGSKPAGAAATVQVQSAKPGLKEELVPLRGIRKTIAERMVKSQATTAQVTHVDEADMTDLVLLREAFKGSAEKRGVRLTYMPFIIKALVPALKEFPYLNALLDEQAGNIILKKYYNIGIATDTEQGLVVPVIKDADTKDMFELAGEIEKLADKARKGQLALGDVHGATFTITNVGAIGGLFATPIINLPEVAILGLHKIAKRPVVREGRIEVRDTTYLSLSFDHRVLDGAYAARFTSRVIETIQDTKKLLAEVL
ncbi:MAG: 2-oxo acid dehydrogenase subunit E2 [Thaumarchaeota archaeon]|nr:2-oxo acid dehydrogenase subunit E2 [Nitrososphaerota archaeon]